MAFDYTHWAFVATVIGAAAGVISLTPQGRSLYFRLVHPIDKSKLNRRKRNRGVFGRDQAAESLHEKLIQQGSTAVVPGASITGSGGVGKTTLARHYISLFGGSYAFEPIVLTAETETDLVDGLASLWSLPLLGGKSLRDHPRNEAQSALHKLATTFTETPWLLVYDNVASLDDVKDWLPPTNNGRVLITSRVPEWPDFATFATDVLDEAASIAVLNDEAERELEGAAELAKTLGYLPLALVQAGEWLRWNETKTVDDYMKNLASHQRLRKWKSWLRPSAPSPDELEYTDTTADVIATSQDGLSLDAKALLRVLVFFDAEGLTTDLLDGLSKKPWLARFVGWYRQVPWPVWALARKPGRREAAFLELWQRGVLEGTKEGPYKLHRVFSLVMRDQMGRRVKKQAGAAAAVLAARYPSKASVSENWPDCARLTPHVLAFRRAVGADAPALAAVEYLYNQTSIYLGQIADHRTALDLARESLRLTEARLGQADYDVAIGYSMLGLALMEAGELAAAVAAMRKDVKLCEDHDHGAAALSAGLNNLSVALDAQAKATGDRDLLVDALQTDERALLLRKEAHGESSPEVAVTLSNLAARHDALGDRAAAIRFGRQALEMDRAELKNPQDTRLGFRLNNLGGFLLKDGQAAEAVDLLREALQIWEAAFAHLDDVHPHVKQTASWLVSAYLVVGDATAARVLADRFDLDWEMLQTHAAQLSQTESPEPG